MNRDPVRIVVSGLIAQHPSLAGMTWHYLQYLLGLRRLGHDVYFIEDSGEWPYELDGGPTGDRWTSDDCRRNVGHLASVMGRFGLSDRWAYRCGLDATWYGLSDVARKGLVSSADVLLNVSGSLEHPEEYRGVPHMIYIDSDPVFTQLGMIQSPDVAERVALHDVHVTFGEKLPGWVPREGIDWLPTRQPIELAAWGSTNVEPRDVFSTVMNWTSYEPVIHEGEAFGQKDVEFDRFRSLPERLPPGVLEIALPALRHPEWEGVAGEGESSDPHAELRSAGWRVVDSIAVAGDLDGYRRYIQSSLGEWSVAKNGYVKASTGWFSERSACYLAAARPVVLQETGFSSVLPTGLGLFSFRTVDEAAAAIEEIRSRPERHAAAARDIAAEYFACDRVLPRLLERVASNA